MTRRIREIGRDLRGLKRFEGNGRGLTGVGGITGNTRVRYKFVKIRGFV